MLTADLLLPPLPPLGLNLNDHGPTIDAHDPDPTLKEPLIEIVGLGGAVAVVALGGVGAGLEGVVARPEQGGAVEAQDVAGEHAVHVEGEAEGVAGGQEVGEAVDVGGDVVGFLRGQVWEEGLYGLGEDERFA
jgi:hypothetical protein